MKITFLVRTFPTLSQTFILNQITYFVEHGHEVKILSFDKPILKEVPVEVEKHKLLEKTVYINKGKSKSSRRMKAANQTVKTFFSHPVLVVRALGKLLISKKSFSYPQLFLALRCIREDPGIMLCHFGPMGALAVILKEIGLKVKLATVFHGYDLSTFLKKNGPDVYKQLFNKGDIFLPISEFWKKKLISLGCPDQKITVHHMGVDLKEFSFRERRYDKNKPFRCLMVSRLVEKKGHVYALKAISELIRENRQIVLEIAGDGPLRDILEQRTKELDIEDNVIFHGPAKHAKVVQLMDQADCFLLPSIVTQEGDMEGIPVVLMEAMASGLPVISTRHSGIPELIIDRQNGLLVPEKCDVSIKEALSDLARHYEDYSSMVQNARKTIQDSFEINHLNTALYEILRTLEEKNHSEFG